MAENKNNKETQDNNLKKKKEINRRDVIKGLAGIPVLGALFYSAWRKELLSLSKETELGNILDVQASPPPPSGSMSGDVLRLGIIGFGSRGESLVRSTGYATPEWLKALKERAAINKNDKRYQTFVEQEDLNIRFTAVCDVYDTRLKRAESATITKDNKPKIYKDYQDLLADKNVDAVIIATPDHWHAPIAIDAIRAGKHVYVEKCMTHKVSETFQLADTVSASKMILQVGHQHRQTESFLTAQDIVSKNILGHIGMVQACTNRNDDNGAWQYGIDTEASPKNIDWKRFLGNAPEIPFNKEHFFRWRKWWPYGTGLCGDLLTHDYDRINCILKMGIPKKVTATGGIYTHKDGREVPDVMQIAMEFPDYFKGSSQPKGKVGGTTFLYSATLGNRHPRPTLLMGHDATMELGNKLTVYVDGDSTRYEKYLKDGVMKPNQPIYSYLPGNSHVDGVTSATAKYFADKGLLYTYRGGKQVDSTHLHIREWLSCIRNGGKPSCGIQEGFEEAISAHMATLSYKTGKTAIWNKDKRKIEITGEKSLSNDELDKIICRQDKS